jgi:hypothetical protein
MDRGHVLRLLDRERRQLAHAGTSIDVQQVLTRASAADGSHHTIVFSSLPAVAADAIIGQEIEYHRRRGVPFEWKAYAHDGPPDLLARLARHGFVIGEREAVVVYDLAHRAAWLEASDHRVVRIERPEQVDVYRNVAERVFGKEYAFTANELATALATGSTQQRGYLAYAGDEPVSIGRLYTHPDSAFGALYGGGTLPTHRGQGFYRALVAVRGRDAAATGATYLLVDALPTSLPILERLGFERLTDTWPCCWSP